MVQCFTKHFNQLSISELYDILHMRSEVFVVEQNCIYQDIDYKDQKAIHVLLKKNKELRIMFSERKQCPDSQLMEASIKVIKTKFNASKISISAQTYLKQFYNNLGFKVTGEEYLEDGIPHIAMIKTNL